MLKLTPDQQAAADTFMKFMTDPDQKVMVLTGFAGTGKSTLVQYLLEMVKSQMKLINLIMLGDASDDIDIHATAPTNKAARVLADILGVPPRTTHNLFGLRPVPDYKTGKMSLKHTSDYSIQENSLVLVDEISFAGNILLDAIREGTKNCKLLLIGDKYQLTDPMDKKSPVFTMPAVRANLTTIVRNLGPIGELAESYRQVIEKGLVIEERVEQGDITEYRGKQLLNQLVFPNIVPNGTDILHLDGASFQQAIEHEFTINEAEKDAKIIAWTNSRVHEYNNHLRRHKGYTPILQIGERVITNKPLITHSFQFSTDSIATVTDVGPDKEQNGIMGNMVGLDNCPMVFLPKDQSQVQKMLKLLAKQKDWEHYYDIKERWADLRPLYSCTVHKSQGSTYPTTFIDLNDIGRCSNVIDLARMLYVGTARASQKVVFYGNLAPCRLSDVYSL